MAHSYTPGLKVSSKARVVKRRILPIKGDVVVSKGDVVSPSDIVARTELPGDVYPVNVANMLGISAAEVPSCMVKKEGDTVERDEVIAVAKSFFGLFKSVAKAPQSGTIESISSVTGQIIIRGAPLPVEVRAYISGRVVDVFPEEGVAVECAGTFIQGIFGIGGETHGDIFMAVNDRSEILDESKISDAMNGKIVVAGSLTTAGALVAAREAGAKAIITGGFDDKDLRDFLGYDLGVAITGHEQIGISLVVTEGFGKIDMAKKTFELLKANEGKQASVNGATQIRAGVIRPEVIIPIEGLNPEELSTAESEGAPTKIGDMIRCIRRPYFGRIGKVVGLPADLVRLESGTVVRVLEVEFEDGSHAILPRANVERIETD